MKKVITLFITVITISLIMTGCSNGIPKGDATDVKDLVIQIAQEETKKQIAVSVSFDLGGPGCFYDYVIKNPEEEHCKKVLETMDSRIKALNFRLSNIRQDKIDEGAKKSFSSADLCVGDKTLPINYSAQYNSEGVLYVEVFGLN